MEPFTYALTWAERHRATRAALAGEPVVTPLHLFIYMGGDPEHFSDDDEVDCMSDLRQHGYQREMIAVRFYGPLEERWVRHEHWPEDDQWPA